jgi:hypothetical protein
MVEAVGFRSASTSPDALFSRFGLVHSLVGATTGESWLDATKNGAHKRLAMRGYR